MKVSIITPSYNQGRFIERTLQSVADQDGVDLEHLVLDGGSSDETIEILERFGQRVRWVSERDKGQADAVNKGIHATNGEIIGWLNSDDVYCAGAVAEVVRFFEANPDVDVLYGMADHIDLEDSLINSYPTERWDFERLKDRCFICQPATFFRRRVIERCGCLNESLVYCMDYELWLRLGKAGARFAYLEQKLAGSRMYAENKTLKKRIEVHAEINGMLKEMFGRVPSVWLARFAFEQVAPRVSRSANPGWFKVRLGLSYLLASIRWNRSMTNFCNDCLFMLVKSK